MNEKPHLLPGKVYHIYTHANGDENLFRSEENYRYFLKKYQQYIFPIAKTFAYCLMPNHIHLVVQFHPEKTVVKAAEHMKKRKTDAGSLSVSQLISRQFALLFSAYTQALNKQTGRKGSLFIPNFKRKTIEDFSYFKSAVAYVHNNPVHHGFSDQPTDWLYNSYHDYLENLPTFVSREWTDRHFDGLIDFMDFHQEYMEPFRKEDF
ncbi:MAG: transposase [Cytophagales bacterium]|nr:transposase [Cytophagales bacterium]